MNDPESETSDAAAGLDSRRGDGLMLQASNGLHTRCLKLYNLGRNAPIHFFFSPHISISTGSRSAGSVREEKRKECPAKYQAWSRWKDNR